MSDYMIVEILNEQGQPVPVGESGEIVVTDLYSRETPFIRYATGDYGALTTRRCACGRPTPLLEKIEGRSTDFIVAPDGRMLHALSVIYILREIDGVAQFKIRQKEVDRFHVHVVKNDRFKPEDDMRIRDGFRKRLHAPVNVQIDYVDSIPPEGSGKFRYVISEVPMREGVRAKEAVS